MPHALCREALCRWQLLCARLHPSSDFTPLPPAEVEDPHVRAHTAVSFSRPVLCHLLLAALTQVCAPTALPSGCNRPGLHLSSAPDSCANHTLCLHGAYRICPGPRPGPGFTHVSPLSELTLLCCSDQNPFESPLRRQAAFSPAQLGPPGALCALTAASLNGSRTAHTLTAFSSDARTGQPSDFPAPSPLMPAQSPKVLSALDVLTEWPSVPQFPHLQSF